MPLKKSKKTKKVKKMHGKGRGTHGTGSRKNKRKSGNRGGCGMAGTGKRADHRKTWVTMMYGHDYFGKAGITSRGTKRDKRNRINLMAIKEKFFKKDGDKIELKSFKILSEGEGFKATIIAQAASKNAIEKMKKAGGEIQVPKIVAPLGVPQSTEFGGKKEVKGEGGKNSKEKKDSKEKPSEVKVEKKEVKAKVVKKIKPEEAKKE